MTENDGNMVPRFTFRDWRDAAVFAKLVIARDKEIIRLHESAQASATLGEFIGREIRIVAGDKAMTVNEALTLLSDRHDRYMAILTDLLDIIPDIPDDAETPDTPDETTAEFQVGDIVRITEHNFGDDAKYLGYDPAGWIGLVCKVVNPPAGDYTRVESLTEDRPDGYHRAPFSWNTAMLARVEPVRMMASADLENSSVSLWEMHDDPEVMAAVKGSVNPDSVGAGYPEEQESER